MHVSKHAALVAALLMLFALPCAANERAFSPVAQEGQEVRFSDGEAVLITGNGIGNIAVSFVPLDRKYGYLRLWVENASEMQFNISEGSITADSGGKPLVVMSYADQVKAQKRKEIWLAVLTGIAAGANSYSASQAGYSNYTGHYSTSRSYGSFSGRSYHGGIAYLAQANAAAQNQDMFDRFSAMSTAAKRSMHEKSLKVNTLLPGQSVIGDVKMYLPRASNAEMSVRIDVAGKPIQVVFREGPPVVDTTPRPVTVAALPEPMQEGAGYPPPQTLPIPEPQTFQPSPGPNAAYANPSAPAARQELLRVGCEQNFNLVSAIPGKAVFEATCQSGKRQLMECRGNGCRPLN